MSGELEKQGKRMQIESLMLHTLAACGALAVVAIAPNAVGALKKLDPDWEAKIDPYRRVTQTLSRLKRKGLVAFSGTGTGRRITLTAKGAMLVEKIDAEKLHIHKPLRWDGRWRVVIFDIAEVRRRTRDAFRHMLRKIGFVRLQGSVWVYPYDCEEVITLVKTNQHLGRQVVYMIVDVLENDSALRNHFNLRAR